MKNNDITLRDKNKSFIFLRIKAFLKLKSYNTFIKLKRNFNHENKNVLSSKEYSQDIFINSAAFTL